MRPNITPLVAVLPALLLLGGCQDPTYESSHACSIPAETVAAVLGTDRFTAPTERLDELPFTDESLVRAGSATCRVDAGDDSLLVQALVIPSTEAPRRAAAIREGGDSFALLGGVARADESVGGWACGSVLATVRLDDDRSSDPADMRSSIDAVAREATCYRAPARAWDPESAATPEAPDR